LSLICAFAKTGPRGPSAAQRSWVTLYKRIHLSGLAANPGAGGPRGVVSFSRPLLCHRGPSGEVPRHSDHTQHRTPDL